MAKQPIVYSLKDEKEFKIRDNMTQIQLNDGSQLLTTETFDSVKGRIMKFEGDGMETHFIEIESVDMQAHQNQIVVRDMMVNTKRIMTVSELPMEVLLAMIPPLNISPIFVDQKKKKK